MAKTRRTSGRKRMTRKVRKMRKGTRRYKHRGGNKYENENNTDKVEIFKSSKDVPEGYVIVLRKFNGSVMAKRKAVAK